MKVERKQQSQSFCRLYFKKEAIPPCLQFVNSISIMANRTTTSLKDFQIVCKLGEGAFAEVFKVKRKEDGLFYAMKKIRISRIKEKERNNALNEVRLMASERNDNVIEYKEAFYDESSSYLCIIMEYASGGDLLKFIQSHSRKHTRIPEKDIWTALVHLSQGLKSLHEKKILHRDLKCANIFITGEGVYKIGDLNVSKVAKEDLARTQTGTPYYASPQIWKDQPYGTKSDMWALGCVLYEMTAQKPPFTAPDVSNLYKKICSGIFQRIPYEYSNDLASVISSLLKLSPSDRPSAGSLLCSDIVQSRFEGELKQPNEWEKDQLLDTIKLTTRNFKSINNMLPRANYQKKKSHERTKTHSLFGDENRHTNNIEEKQLVFDKIKQRVDTSHFENDVSDRNSKELLRKRERTISAYEPVTNIKSRSFQKSQQSSICRQTIINQAPFSQKITKKLPEINNYIKTPHISNCSSLFNDPKLPPRPSPLISRRKFESLINNPSIFARKSGNKEGTKKSGENIHMNIHDNASLFPSIL